MVSLESVDIVLSDLFVSIGCKTEVNKQNKYTTFNDALEKSETFFEQPTAGFYCDTLTVIHSYYIRCSYGTLITGRFIRQSRLHPQV